MPKNPAKKEILREGKIRPKMKLKKRVRKKTNKTITKNFWCSEDLKIFKGRIFKIFSFFLCQKT